MSPRLAATLVLASSVAVSVGADSVALRGGRIVSVSGPTLERGTLVMTDGRIAALGAEVEPPPGARVIDVTGQTLYPGLIDALTTLALVEITAVPASSDVTEVVDLHPQGLASVALNAHSELLPVARANGITTALAAPAGRLVSGRSALLRLRGATPAELTRVAPLALHVVYPGGRPAGDGGGDEPPKTFEEREKERRERQAQDLRRLEQALGEARALARALAAARAGRGSAPPSEAALEALAPFALGHMPVIMRADSEDDIRGAVAFGRQQGLKLIVAGGLEAWRCAALLREHDVPVLLNVTRLPRREADDYDAAYANAARLEQAGVRFAIVSDDAHNARNLPYEATLAHAFGLPREAALRAITLSPAEILGVGARLGSLEAGKEADVVVADGDILDVRTHVTRVFIGGIEQSLDTRHTRLYETFKDRRAPR